MKPFHFVHIFFIFGASFPVQSLMIQIQSPLSLPDSTNNFPAIYIFQLFICLILLRLYVPPEPHFCLPDTRSSAESPEIPHIFFFSACPDFFSCSGCESPHFPAAPALCHFPPEAVYTKTAAGSERTGGQGYLCQNPGSCFLFILPGIQLMIVSAHFQKFPMGSLLHDPAVADHQDQVCIAHRG